MSEKLGEKVSEKGEAGEKLEKMEVESAEKAEKSEKAESGSESGEEADGEVGAECKLDSETRREDAVIRGQVAAALAEHADVLSKPTENESMHKIMRC